jgi:hypothetical protein
MKIIEIIKEARAYERGGRIVAQRLLQLAQSKAGRRGGWSGDQAMSIRKPLMKFLDFAVLVPHFS